MEPRSAVASFDSDSGRLTLQAGCQSAHGMQASLMELLDVEADKLHVIAPDTGGGFGARSPVYPEFIVALIAARKLARPVKWTSTRSEAFLTDYQARDHQFYGELALNNRGCFLGLRVRADWRHGAYLPGRCIWIMAQYLSQILGCT